MREKEIPAVTVDQMRHVDKVAVKEFGLDIIIMMENAGIRLAEFVQSKFLRGKKRNVVILAGSGNNGGDGLAAARHLINRGYEVRIFLTKSPKQFKKEPKKQYEILDNMEADIVEFGNINELRDSLSWADVIVDSLLGYSIQGDPRVPVDTMIHLTNESKKPVVACDTPSGLDLDSGEPYSPCIRAVATVTLALPKAGLLKKSAQPYVGELFVADLSIPRQLYEELGISDVGIFSA